MKKPLLQSAARARHGWHAIAALSATVGCFLTLSSAYGAGGAAEIPRLANGRPDFSGIWQTLSAADYDLEAHSDRTDAPPFAGAIQGGSIPYVPKALERKRRNFAARLTADPRLECWTLGTPRGIYYPEPFQIFERSQDLTIVFQFGDTVRDIHTNGTLHPLDTDNEFWLGDSRGHWEGDTLVVDVRDFNDQTWLDRAGDFHDEALHVVERWKFLDANTIHYQATLDDPGIYSRPWTLQILLYRHLEKNFHLIEDYCYTLDYDQYYPFPPSYRRPDPAGSAELRRAPADGDALIDASSTPAAPQAPKAPQAPRAPQASAGLGPRWEKTVPKIASGKWTGKRLPDGQPDVQGDWSNTIANQNNFTDPQGGIPGDPDRRGRPLGPRDQRAPSRVSDPADGQIPYQPWARAIQQRLQANFFNPVRPEYIEPLDRCAPAGIPKSFYWHGFEIRQFPGYVLLLFNSGHRIIQLDGTPHLPASMKLWMGDSRGHWEGNTLVVDVSNLNSKARFGRTGNFASENVHVVERYVFDNNGRRFNYVATFDDPTVYTRAWTATIPMRRFTVADRPNEWSYEVLTANAPGRPPLADHYERICQENNGGFGHVAASAPAVTAAAQPPARTQAPTQTPTQATH